ncbi:glycosyl transferase group 1 [Rippkaea orientalis PCC 8801]|uniref:Glycosyl transferase group 1 n=1 Tax=Rippkaea orientalis (strain PCC 8801 / RF-1) TaxID=41431 RepID=B7K4C3_RIPO1|nr:glycosyltransferase family 4 protein [Rippkaea orientalis]ACK67829.1 glycosyl transferase group 1 [Rippkaea orientalis PCC 8801]
MKITFVLPPVNLCGGLRSTANLALHLGKRGHEVLAVCPERRKPTLYQQAKSLLKGKGWMDTRTRWASPFDELPVPLKVVSHISPITDLDLPDADVVVATWWETAEWVNKLSASKGAKVYFIRHHEVHDYLPLERVKATYKLPLHKITISQWLVDLMKTEYGDHTVSLVYNSVNFQKYYAPPRGKQSVPTVGMLYHTTKWKGCDISLKAFELAKQEIPDLKMVAFGLNSPLPELPLPTGTLYHCNPPQERIKDIYAQCDAWLFGSRVEGFGRPILEAMACRTPVIATPAGAAPELIAKGGGKLVKPESSEDMAEAIVQISQLNQEKWQKMSDSAYIAAKSYTWDDAAELCEQAFHKAIERTKNGELG